MGPWIHPIVIIISCILGSGGLWAFLEKRLGRKSAQTRLMMGMAYTQITTLGIMYLDRGSITLDELEELRRYFFEPYTELGGNGTAKRIMHDVEKLPLRSHVEHGEIFGNQEARYIHNVPVITRAHQ